MNDMSVRIMEGDVFSEASSSQAPTPSPLPVPTPTNEPPPPIRPPSPVLSPTFEQREPADLEGVVVMDEDASLAPAMDVANELPLDVAPSAPQVTLANEKECLYLPPEGTTNSLERGGGVRARAHACVALGRCVAFGRPKMSVWGHAGARSAPAKVACISFTTSLFWYLFEGSVSIFLF